MQLVHVVNRGVDKRKIFMDDKDYIRFIHDMFEFNDVESVQVNLNYYFQKYSDVGRPNIVGGGGHNDSTGLGIGASRCSTP